MVVVHLNDLMRMSASLSAQIVVDDAQHRKTRRRVLLCNCYYYCCCDVVADKKKSARQYHYRHHLLLRGGAASASSSSRTFHKGSDMDSRRENIESSNQSKSMKKSLNVWIPNPKKISRGVKFCD